MGGISPDKPSRQQLEFLGYPRPVGRAGVRNTLLVLGINGLITPTARRIAQALPGCKLAATPYGRGQLGPDKDMHFAQLVGLGSHPNSGATLIVGVDRPSADAVAAAIAARSGKAVAIATLDDVHEDALALTALAVRRGGELARLLSTQRRVPVPVAELFVGIECGHSDATSGLVSNPLAGALADRLVDCGGTAVIGETLEWLGAEHVLAERAIDGVVGTAIVEAVAKRERAVAALGVDLLYNNPGHENVRGGLSSIEEKSLGAIAKAGERPIRSVLAFAAPPPCPGLHVMDGPGFSPESLTGFAAAGAQSMRATIAERLRPGRGRRDFWERFSDRAFGPAPRAEDAQDLVAAIDQIAGNADVGRGRVTLVGAGPGDPELLTLKAVRALQAADVILFDDLVSDEVLELARREAKRILVGKRGGRESCRQDDINDLMVRLAGAGRRVVRLKSGDPTLFGRAGEEIAQLQAAGIPVDIVPGITAGIAMAAALGISLTHRGHAKSVRFVTGHSRRGGLPEDVDWRAIADPSATTIFYMSGRTAGAITDRLVALGLSPDTPAAVASALSRPEQTLVSTRLKDLAAVVASIGLSQPVAIGIGQAFGATGALTCNQEQPSQTAAARRA